MPSFVPRSHIASLVMALAGPAAIGASIGLPNGAAPMLRQLLAIPAILVGTSLFMLPALYIASSLVGIAPSASSVLSSWIAAQRDAGVLLLGLAPACLFLLATSQSVAATWLLGSAAVCAGACLSLRTIHSGLFVDVPRVKSVPLFSAWAAVALGLGIHLFVKSFAM
mgnify:CR=1 FL=1